MNLSSFCFGILLLLKASFAQSAPHSYADEDEEALIDRLASLAAAVGPDALLSKSALPQNYDIPQLGYISNGGLMNEEAVARDAVLKMPRQFGYKPTDLRFYLPSDQFPQYPQIEEGLQQKFLLDNAFPNVNSGKPQWRNEANVRINTPPQEQQQQQRLPMSVNPSDLLNTANEITPSQDAHHRQNGQPEAVGDGQSDFYFMKKKELDNSHGSPIRSYVPGPSHIMASDHSANYPGYSASQIPDKPFTYTDMYYIAIVAGCSAAAVVGVVAAGICYYRIHERIKAAADVDYPAYGVTGPSKDITPSGGDRKLAQSAQMYHYQHQKQQMAALQKGATQGDRQGSGGSDVESEDDNEDGDYTVYECPGLAPAGEMEVKNPLFQDEPTPATPQATKGNEEEQEPEEHKSSPNPPEKK